MRILRRLKVSAAATLVAFGAFVATATPVAADVPTYRDKGPVPASMSDRLKRAAAYIDTPGSTLRAPSGPVRARRVIVGNTAIMVFTSTGRNSPRAIAETARRQTACNVATNAKFRTIRHNSISPIGYAMPCSGRI